MDGEAGWWTTSGTIGLPPPTSKGHGGEWMTELGLGFTNPVETGGVLDMCLVFWLRWCGWCRWGVGRGLDQSRERWGGVMSV